MIPFIPFSLKAAEQGDTGPLTAEKEIVLTLDQMIGLGREVSPRLWSQRYIIDEAEAQLKQARAGRLPRMEYWQIFGVVNAARGDAHFSPDNRTDLLNELGPFTRLELMVTQPLYTFGRLKAHIESAEKGVEAQKASLDRFKVELILSLKDLYYTLQLNEELHRLVADTEKQMQKAVDKASDLLEEEDAVMTQQDLLKLRYGLHKAGGELLKIEKGKKLVRAALQRLLCIPGGQKIVLADRRLKPVNIELQDLETYKMLASANRPEWKQLDAGIAAREAELRAEKREYYPNIFLSGILRYGVAPNRDKQENPFVVDDFNYFDGGMFLGWRWALDFGLPQRISEKKAGLFALIHEQKDATTGMLLEVEKVYQEVVEKKQGLSFARKARKNGRGLAALSAASFHMGLGEAKEVFEAYDIYTKAAAEYYMAIKDFNMAVAELSRVTGMSLKDQERQRFSGSTDDG